MPAPIFTVMGAAAALAVVAGVLLDQVAARRGLRRVATPTGGAAADPVDTAAAGLLRGPHRPTASLPLPDRVRLGVRDRWRRPSASTALFAACFGLYVGLGALLVLRYGAIVGDAQSRVADGYYVFFSRDPHLAAIGFVWNPLPSMAAWPFFPFKGLWPALTQQAFAGNIVSAAFMAGTIVTLRGCLRDIGAGRTLTMVLVLSVALNPMVVYYGANGMSEAAYLFFLILAVRHLMRWTTTRALTPLVWTGVALGLGYLARYETIAATCAATAVVFALSFRAAGGERKQRILAGVAEAVVVAIPALAAFAAWSLISEVITGSAFQQFTSIYGNSSQIAISGAGLVGHQSGWPLPVYAGLQLLAFGVGAPIVVLLGLLVAKRQHDGRLVAAVAVIGTCVAFSYGIFVSGRAFGWLRFYLPVTLLVSLCLALMVGAAGRPRLAGGPRRSTGAATVVAILVAVSALPTTAWAMFDRRLGAGEKPQLTWVLHGVHTPGQRADQRLFPSARAIAADLDRRLLPDGAVVIDTFSPCASMILMTSSRPHQFVITSDRDFERTLADPSRFGAAYLMAPPTGGYGDLDAVNRAYPDLYRDGTGVGRLIHQYAQVGCPAFRLYRVAAAKP
ncbi:MAG: hypothetical protein JWN46_1848 [Acidimicrobiales bacterium]|nr:hypothetical protein [Acidimicrobiales bacterium]